jgi:ATP-dependent Clp protease ATP-binding subunit ClpA
VEETISILRGLKERYEVHHGVRITDAAVIAAATLSHRYITDRHLPDKAIDLIDEAAARLRTEIDSNRRRWMKSTAGSCAGIERQAIQGRTKPQGAPQQLEREAAIEGAGQSVVPAGK